MNEKKHFDWLRLWAGIGLVHYALAVAGWSWVAFGVLRFGADRATWIGVALGIVPCLTMLALAAVAVALAQRKRRFTKRLVAVLTLVTFCWFSFDAYRHNYQIQAMTTHGCEHGYITWWWYNDQWDPRR